MEERDAGRPPGAVIVRTRRRGTVIFGCLTGLWLLALAVAEGAQPTASGRAGAGIIFGGLAALSIGSWFAVNINRRRLEVGRDEIVLQPGNRGKPFTLTRVESDTLRILPQFRMLGAVRPPRLMFLGRGGFIGLRGFPLDQVRQACEAQGWRFDGDPSLAVVDVQAWLHQGRSVEAAQLVELFGPFPAAAADGEQHTGLVAAVYEDFGDKTFRTARANAREAYRRGQRAARLRRVCAVAARERRAAGRGGPDRRKDTELAEANRFTLIRTHAPPSRHGICESAQADSIFGLAGGVY